MHKYGKTTLTTSGGAVERHYYRCGSTRRCACRAHVDVPLRGADQVEVVILEGHTCDSGETADQMRRWCAFVKHSVVSKARQAMFGEVYRRICPHHRGGKTHRGKGHRQRNREEEPPPQGQPEKCNLTCDEAAEALEIEVRAELQALGFRLWFIAQQQQQQAVGEGSREGVLVDSLLD